MNDMLMGLLSGALLSIPLSILANILTPLTQRIGSRANTRIRERVRAKRATQIEIVNWFTNNLMAFQLYLLNAILQTLRQLVIIGLIIGIAVMYYTQNPEPVEPAWLYWSIYAIAFMGILLIGNMLGNLLFRATSLWSEVRRGRGWPVDERLLRISTPAQDDSIAPAVDPPTGERAGAGAATTQQP